MGFTQPLTEKYGLEYTTGDNEIAAEARSQWRSFAIESAVRSQLLEEGVKREEVGEQVGDLLRDDRFMATFSKVGLYSSRARVDFEQKSGQNFFGFEPRCFNFAIIMKTQSVSSVVSHCNV